MQERAEVAPGLGLISILKPALSACGSCLSSHSQRASSLSDAIRPMLYEMAVAFFISCPDIHSDGARLSAIFGRLSAGRDAPLASQ
jgi:hypothetical protein